MHVEIINSEFIEATQRLIAENQGGEVIKLLEMMLGMCSVIGLE